MLVNPRVDLQQGPGLEALALVEYRPAIHGNDWRLYSRVQALYNHDTGSGAHARSYVFTRLGISYEDVTVGAAANVDWYGPRALGKSNLGGLLRLALL